MHCPVSPSSQIIWDITLIIYKEGWVLKNWCVWIVVLEKTLESPLDCKEIKPVSPKGNQLWIFIGRTDAKAKAPVLWPLDVKSWLTGKDSDPGKGWGQEEKGAIEDEMVGCHHQLDGHEFEQTLGDSKGQESLVYCSSWDCRVRHSLATEQRTTTLITVYPLQQCTFLFMY